MLHPVIRQNSERKQGLHFTGNPARNTLKTGKIHGNVNFVYVVNFVYTGTVRGETAQETERLNEIIFNW
jgi:hypothetical protein